MDTCEHKSAKYLKINPNGKVPALAIDGRGVMFETKEVERLGRIGEVEHPLGIERPDGISIAGASPDLGATVGGAAHDESRPSGGDQGQGHGADRRGLGSDRAGACRGGPDMLGDRFSAADLPVPMLSHWRQAQPDMLSRPKGLGRLADLVFVRPAVRRALEQNQPAA